MSLSGNVWLLVSSFYILHLGMFVADHFLSKSFNFHICRYFAQFEYFYLVLRVLLESHISGLILVGFSLLYLINSIIFKILYKLITFCHLFYVSSLMFVLLLSFQLCEWKLLLVISVNTVGNHNPSKVKDLHTVLYILFNCSMVSSSLFAMAFNEKS